MIGISFSSRLARASRADTSAAVARTREALPLCTRRASVRMASRGRRSVVVNCTTMWPSRLPSFLKVTAIRVPDPGSDPNRLRSAAPYLVLVGLALLAPLWADLHWRTTFDSDEAVIGLMAARAGQGHPALYFWGQQYLGGLDALLSAPLVVLAGDQVPALRVV